MTNREARSVLVADVDHPQTVRDGSGERLLTQNMLHPRLRSRNRDRRVRWSIRDNTDHIESLVTE